MVMTETKWTEKITGWCPLVSCLRMKPHRHSVCSLCGAVQHGNFGCEECQRYRATHFYPTPETDTDPEI